MTRLNKIRDEMAYAYSTGNNSVSYADTSDACAFAEGFNASTKLWQAHCEKLVEALNILMPYIQKEADAAVHENFGSSNSDRANEVCDARDKLYSILRQHKEFMGDE